MNPCRLAALSCLLASASLARADDEEETPSEAPVEEATEKPATETAEYARPAAEDEGAGTAGSSCEKQLLDRDMSSLESTAARDLSRKDARDLLAWYHLKGWIQLNTTDGKETPPKFDASCAITWPGVNDQVYLNQDIHPRGAGQVLYRYVAFGDWKASSWKPQSSSLNNLHPRLAVFLYRFAAKMMDDFGADTVYHAGVGKPGPSGSTTDSHGTGRALDFVGIHTASATITVQTDWTAAAPYTADSYRLAGTGTTAETMFQAAYDLGVANCNDAAGGSTIGAGSEILSPDHPNAGLRKDHGGHMHFDVPK
jgi:hypothetical protein